MKLRGPHQRTKSSPSSNLNQLYLYCLIATVPKNVNKVTSICWQALESM
jgi:hypothetical protein